MGEGSLVSVDTLKLMDFQLIRFLRPTLNSPSADFTSSFMRFSFTLARTDRSWDVWFHKIMKNFLLIDYQSDIS